METNIDNKEEITLTAEDLEEIVVAIPKNAGLIKMSVLCIREEGQYAEFAGTYDLKSIMAARAKYTQLSGGDVESTISEDKEEAFKADA